MNLQRKLKVTKKKNRHYSKYYKNGLVTGRFYFGANPGRIFVHLYPKPDIIFKMHHLVSFNYKFHHIVE
jgi:hypothetical protein